MRPPVFTDDHVEAGLAKILVSTVVGRTRSATPPDPNIETYTLGIRRGLTFVN